MTKYYPKPKQYFINSWFIAARNVVIFSFLFAPSIGAPLLLIISYLLIILTSFRETKRLVKVSRKMLSLQVFLANFIINSTFITIAATIIFTVTFAFVLLCKLLMLAGILTILTTEVWSLSYLAIFGLSFIVFCPEDEKISILSRGADLAKKNNLNSIFITLMKYQIIGYKSQGEMEKALRIGLELAYNEIKQGKIKEYSTLLGVIADESSYIQALELEALCCDRLCVFLRLSGAYSKAIEVGTRALDITSKYYDKSLKSEVLSALGHVYEDIGENFYEKARQLYEEALEIDSELNYENAKAWDYNDLGNIWDKLKNAARAIEMYEKALELFIQLSNTSGQCGVYTNIGTIYHKGNNFKKAIDYHQKALQMAKIINNKSTQAVSWLNLGYCYFATERFSDSLNSFQAALPIAQELEERKEEIKALQGSANCYLALGSPEKAKLYYQKALPHLEVMGFGLTGDERRSLINQYLDIYSSLVETCLKTEDYSLCIFYIEIFRSQYLVEQFIKQEIKIPETVPAEICKQIESVKLLERKALQAYTDGLSKNLEQSIIASLNFEWMSSRKELNNLYDEVAKIAPEFVIQTQVYPVSFTEAQSLLRPDTAVIEFFFSKSKLIVAIFTSESEEPQIPEDICLREKSIYLQSIAKAWISDVASKGKQSVEIKEVIQDLDSRINYISELLRFKNLLSYIPESVQHLVIIPHSYLHLFPIHALWITEQERLIDRFSVQYCSNLQIWKLCQNRQRSHWQFLGIQNPTEDKDLIFAKAEVSTISESTYFVQSTVLQEKNANKNLVLKVASEYECFHFSGHAEYIFENPLDSYLMLSEESEDNLTLRLILSDMHLPKADLVTLSACCTGVVDAFQITDEYLGLPTGFLLAGAKAVVSSLWKVNSIATAFLLDEFYRQLEQTSNKAVALQNAQKWLKEASASELREQVNRWDLSKLDAKERFRLQAVLHGLEGFPFENPYYWAAFTLTGG